MFIELVCRAHVFFNDLLGFVREAVTVRFATLMPPTVEKCDRWNAFRPPALCR